jgi:thiaminase/transcriptional activator TenA
MTAPLTTAPSQGLTADLWAAASPIFAAILEHPFLRGLTDGSLPEERFRFYVKQDSLYLREYARCLALASAKAPTGSWCEMFAAHAQSALNVERSLHEAYFAAWGLAPGDVEATPPTPTTLAYTSYLLRVAGVGTFEELIGAILPCYWIYWEVGKPLPDGEPVRVDVLGRRLQTRSLAGLRRGGPVTRAAGTSHSRSPRCVGEPDFES